MLVRFRVGRLAIGAVLLFLAGSLAAEAQQAGKLWRIGLFHVGLDHVPPSLEPFRAGMKALGYEEGKNVYLDWRNLPDEAAAREAAAAFVRDRVDLIVAFENLTVRAARAATTDIPVVFVHALDPVENGFVKSLAHPGGNMTGFTSVAGPPAKTIQIFQELVPRLQRLLVLVDPKDPETPAALVEAQTSASQLKITMVRRDASAASDLERIFRTLKRGEVDGVFAASPYLTRRFFPLLIRLTREKRLPLATHRKEWVEQGALFSYGIDLAPVGTSAAGYVDRILKGVKAADLPVVQPTKFELVINLKTARALGLTLPQSVMLRADHIIE